MIGNLYMSNYMNKCNNDICWCIIEYFKENIFNKDIKQLILLLEDDNILITLL